MIIKHCSLGATLYLVTWCCAPTTMTFVFTGGEGGGFLIRDFFHFVSFISHI